MAFFVFCQTTKISYKVLWRFFIVRFVISDPPKNPSRNKEILIPIKNSKKHSEILIPIKEVQKNTQKF